MEFLADGKLVSHMKFTTDTSQKKFQPHLSDEDIEAIGSEIITADVVVPGSWKIINNSDLILSIEFSNRPPPVSLKDWGYSSTPISGLSDHQFYGASIEYIIYFPATLNTELKFNIPHGSELTPHGHINRCAHSFFGISLPERYIYRAEACWRNGQEFRGVVNTVKG